jgi:hypothetical protein
MFLNSVAENTDRTDSYTRPNITAVSDSCARSPYELAFLSVLCGSCARAPASLLALCVPGLSSSVAFANISGFGPLQLCRP